MVEKDKSSPGAKRRRSSGATRRSLDLSVNQETEEQPQKSSIHVRTCLTLCIHMDSPIHIDTISMGLLELSLIGHLAY